MTDIATMKVGEIRELLVSKYDYTEGGAAFVKGKANLLNALQEAIEEQQEEDAENDEDLDQIDLDVDTTEEPNSDIAEENTQPACGSPEWNDYVLSLLEPDEVFDGNPTTDGLRRVAHTLFDITSIITDVVQVPIIQDQYRATVKVTISTLDCQYSGVSDVHASNAQPPFVNSPVAYAETRAEGRALKRMLLLKKVNAAEEISDIAKIPISFTQNENKEYIVGPQIKFIDLMCNKERGQDINVEKFIHLHYADVKTITEVKYDDFLNVLQSELTEYQNGAKEKPIEITGYNSNWRDTF